MNILPRSTIALNPLKAASKNIDASELSSYFAALSAKPAQARRNGEVYNITEVILADDQVHLQCELDASPMKSSSVANMLLDYTGAYVYLYFVDEGSVEPVLSMTKRYVEAAVEEVIEEEVIEEEVIEEEVPFVGVNLTKVAAKKKSLADIQASAMKALENKASRYAIKPVDSKSKNLILVPGVFVTFDKSKAEDGDVTLEINGLSDIPDMKQVVFIDELEDLLEDTVGIKLNESDKSYKTLISEFFADDAILASKSTSANLTIGSDVMTVADCDEANGTHTVSFLGKDMALAKGDLHAFGKMLVSMTQEDTVVEEEDLTDHEAATPQSKLIKDLKRMGVDVGVSEADGQITFTLEGDVTEESADSILDMFNKSFNEDFINMEELADGLMVISLDTSDEVNPTKGASVDIGIPPKLMKPLKKLFDNKGIKYEEMDASLLRLAGYKKEDVEKMLELYPMLNRVATFS